MIDINSLRTVDDLRSSGYVVKPIREEIRDNLIQRIRAEEIVFPGIIGFEDSVIPQLENAILAGQDVILLGERGQAKSRLIRAMVNLLDEFIPTIAGCEINDSPLPSDLPGVPAPRGRRGGQHPHRVAPPRGALLGKAGDPRHFYRRPDR